MENKTKEIPAIPKPAKGNVMMCRGKVVAEVAPQDIDGFKAAGYSVIE